MHATPTKPGRPAAGLDYVAYAAASVTKPWFAIGGLHAGNVAAAVQRGARRVVVVRALTEAPRGVAGDEAQAEAVEAAARELRRALEVPVGAAQP